MAKSKVDPEREREKCYPWKRSSSGVCLKREKQFWSERWGQRGKVWSEGNGSTEEVIGKRGRKWRKISDREENKEMRRRRRKESKRMIGRSERKQLEGWRKMRFYTWRKKSNHTFRCRLLRIDKDNDNDNDDDGVMNQMKTIMEEERIWRLKARERRVETKWSLGLRAI